MAQNTDAPLLKVEHLSKTYRGEVGPDGKRTLVHALQDVSFSVQRGEFLAIVGVSGSGKSTLIHCLASFESPDSDPSRKTPPIQCRRQNGLRDILENLDWYRQNFVGVVFQAFHLLPNLRVGQNVEIPLALDRCERFTVDRQQRKEESAAVLDRLGVRDLMDRRIGQVSGGEKQRVAIARALVKGPQLLLADEPTGNLDEENKKNLVEILAKLAKQGTAVVMVTHDQRFVTDHANRIITLCDGRIVGEKQLRPLELADNGEPTAKGPSGESSAPKHDSNDSGKSDSKSDSQDRSKDSAAQNKDGNDPSAFRFPGPVGESPKDDSDSETPLQPSDPVGTAVCDVAEELDHDSEQRSARQPAAATSVEDPPAPAAVTASRGRGASGRAATAATAAGDAGAPSIGARLLNPLRAIRLPGCSQRLFDLGAFAIRDARESSISLLANVVAILFGAVLTALLLALLTGTDRFIAHMMQLVPNIDSVHAWVDYSTGEAPMTGQEYETLEAWSDAQAVVPNIQQFTTIYLRETRPTVVTLVSAVKDDPEISRLHSIDPEATVTIDPDGWDVVLPESIAAEIDNFNTHGLVGKELTIELRRYGRADNPGDAKPTKIVKLPVRVTGIVKNSYKDRVFGSLNMVRFIRDFSTARSEYSPEPGGRIDVGQVSDRTRFEGVRVHFAGPMVAERNFNAMKSRLGERFEFYWAGSELLYLRDVQMVAFIVLLGVGLITVLAGSISIFNTLRASVARKASEIGILRSLGATPGDIFVIFLLQSIIVGVVAAVIGLLTASLLTPWLNRAVFGLVGDDLPAGLQPDSLQATMAATGGLFILTPLSMAAIFCGVLLICVVAAVWPSLAAARQTPMDALRMQTQ